VVKRIEMVFHLRADEQHREAAERVLGFYADYCPVARSVRDSIDISSKLEISGEPGIGYPPSVAASREGYTSK
jgi:uncharacterized OsmC-like protein